MQIQNIYISAAQTITAKPSAWAEQRGCGEHRRVSLSKWKKWKKQSFRGKCGNGENGENGVGVARKRTHKLYSNLMALAENRIKRRRQTQSHLQQLHLMRYLSISDIFICPILLRTPGRPPAQWNLNWKLSSGIFCVRIAVRAFIALNWLAI